MKGSETLGGLPSPEFESQFRAQALGFEGGADLLERLEGLPCGLFLILMFVQLYCGSQVESPTRVAIKAHTLSKKRLAETLAKLQQDLIRLAGRVEDTNRNPAVAQELVRYVLDQTFQLPGAMRTCASQLATIEASLSKQAHDASGRWAKMNALRMLTQFVRNDAGEPDCPAIARVLEIGYLAFGTVQTVDIRDLKKSVKRAKALMTKQITSMVSRPHR
jgi:hypothetical protein